MSVFLPCQRINARSAAFVIQSIVSAPGCFGTGADGNVTICACSAICANKNYNNLTINASKKLNTKGHIVKVKCTLTIAAGGILTDCCHGGAGGCSCNRGQGGCNGHVNGFPGTVGVVGSCGTSINGHTGGKGGPQGGGGGGGGNGYPGEASPNKPGIPGRPGGAGGGVVVWRAQKINNAGKICAAGKAGTSSTNVGCRQTAVQGEGGGGGGGAGGGGDGGFICGSYNSTTGSGLGTITAAGGAHGNTGANGACGTGGTLGSGIITGGSGGAGGGGINGSGAGGAGGFGSSSNSTACCGIIWGPGQGGRTGAASTHCGAAGTVVTKVGNLGGVSIPPPPLVACGGF